MAGVVAQAKGADAAKTALKDSTASSDSGSDGGSVKVVATEVDINDEMSALKDELKEDMGDQIDAKVD